MLLHGPAGEQMLAIFFLWFQMCSKTNNNCNVLTWFCKSSILRVSQWFASLRQPVVDRCYFFTKGWCVSPWLGKNCPGTTNFQTNRISRLVLENEWGHQCVHLEGLCLHDGLWTPIVYIRLSWTHLYFLYIANNDCITYNIHQYDICSSQPFWIQYYTT